jgi:hypothetical protein
VPPRRGGDGVVVEVVEALHDATAGTALAAGHEGVCHNDPSPCNSVSRSRRACSEMGGPSSAEMVHSQPA